MMKYGCEFPVLLWVNESTNMPKQNYANTEYLRFRKSLIQFVPFESSCTLRISVFSTTFHWELKLLTTLSYSTGVPSYKWLRVTIYNIVSLQLQIYSQVILESLEINTFVTSFIITELSIHQVFF